jgi:hypothetical protein
VKKMTVERAREIAAELAKIRARWGKHASPPVTQDDLFEAVTVLVEAGNFDAPSQEEITKLRRQLAACQNREKGRQQKSDDAV